MARKKRSRAEVNPAEPMRRKPRLFSALALLFLLVTVLPGGALCADDDDDFYLAASMIEDGHFLEAVGVYRGIAGSPGEDNTRARALFFLGTTLNFYLDQPEAALSRFSEVMAEYPESPTASDALLSSGIVLYDTGRYREALSLFERYIGNYPRSMRLKSAGEWAESARARLGNSGAWSRGDRSLLYLPDSVVRVLLKRCAPKVTLGSDSVLTVRGEKTGRTVYRGKGPLLFKKSGGRCVLNGKRMGDRVFFVDSAIGRITLDNRRFRGRFRVVLEKKGYIVVNHVPLEHYLYGVVPREMSTTWEKQALMAQAVASRTYVLQIMGKKRGGYWDLDSTTKFQVYGGLDVETANTNHAVDSTRGRVITHKGKPIIAYFHANSGGHTEDPANVWGASLPYLKGVPDPYSAGAPDSGWGLFLSYAEIETLFWEGKGNEEVWKTALEPLGKSGSGRIFELLVFPGSGPRLVTGNDFRIRVGATRLRSTLFTLTEEGGGFRFRGKGYGHGVGMSQWGAQIMAQGGFDFRKILRHYYRDIEFKSVITR